MDYPSLLRELANSVKQGTDDTSVAIIELLQKKTLAYESFKAASKAPDPTSPSANNSGNKVPSPDSKYVIHVTCSFRFVTIQYAHVQIRF
jgi:hypothetical protein